MTINETNKLNEAISKMQAAHKAVKQRKKSEVSKLNDSGFYSTGDNQVKRAKISDQTPFIYPEYRKAVAEFIAVSEPIIKAFEEDEERVFKEAEAKYSNEMKRIRKEHGQAVARHSEAMRKYTPVLLGDFNDVLRYSPAPSVFVGSRSSGMINCGGGNSALFSQMKSHISTGEAVQARAEEEAERLKREEEEKAIAEKLAKESAKLAQEENVRISKLLPSER